MRKLFIGLTAALAMVLGLAAPASAANVGAQAVVGIAYVDTTGTIPADVLTDIPLLLCRPLALPALSARNLTTFLNPRTISFYGADTNGNGLCDENFIVSVPPNSGLVPFSSAALRYQVS